MLDDFKPAPKRKPTQKVVLRTSLDDVADATDSIPAEEPTVVSTEPTPETDQAPQFESSPSKSSEAFKVKTSPDTSRKRKIVIASICALVIAAGAGYYWYSSNQNNAPATQVVEQKTLKVEKPKIYSPLSGAEVATKTIAERPVTGLMVENSPDARPQSGLDSAGIVFEAIAEGGITRFLALFQETSPEYIGPVRSARPYYVEWVKPFDASYGHVGGSADAIAMIKALGVKDIDQFANGSSYYRVNNRAAPHNVYTDFTKLDALNEKKGYTKSTFTPWARKQDVKQTPTANVIDINISGPTYSPKYTYDAATNTYKRSQAGAPHTVVAKDLTTKVQLSPKTVIALVTRYGIASDGQHSDYQTSGTGKIFVFQDGIVSTGTWAKQDGKSPLVFTDKNGLPMKLNRGQTWVTVVGGESSVSYKP